MKKLGDYKHGELAKTILAGLAVGGFIAVTLVVPTFPMIVSLFKPKNYKERYKLKRSVYNLEKRGFIKTGDQKGVGSIVLTKSGLRKIKSYSIDSLQIYKPKKWDELWRIVIFDIPEKRKKVRQEINFRLKNLGFHTYQDSVFINPYECLKEIDILRNHFFVKKFVKYLVVKQIEEEVDLKKHFKI